MHTSIKLANDSIVYSEGVSTVLFQPSVNGKVIENIKLTLVLHIPEINNNLLSIIHMTQNNGFPVIILSQRMDFVKNNMIQLTAGINEGNAAFLNGKTVCLVEDARAVRTTELDINLWHKRLSHQNYADIHEIYKRNIFTRLDIRGE